MVLAPHPHQRAYALVTLNDNYPGGVPNRDLVGAGFAGILYRADLEPTAPDLLLKSRGFGLGRSGYWAVPWWNSATDYEKPTDFATRVIREILSFEERPEGRAPINMVFLNIELIAKGLLGSARWNYMNKVLTLYRARFPTRFTQVAITALQDKATATTEGIDYDSIIKLGCHVSVEAYDSDMNPWNPVTSFKRVVANGVDPRKVHIMFAQDQMAWYSTYLTSLAQEGMVGYSVFLAPQPVSPDYGYYKELVHPVSLAFS